MIRLPLAGTVAQRPAGLAFDRRCRAADQLGLDHLRVDAFPDQDGRLAREPPVLRLCGEEACLLMRGEEEVALGRGAVLRVLMTSALWLFGESESELRPRFDRFGDLAFEQFLHSREHGQCFRRQDRGSRLDEQVLRSIAGLER